MDIIINHIVKPCFNKKNKFSCQLTDITLLCRNFAVFPYLPEFRQNPFSMTFKVCYNLLVQSSLSLLY